MQKQVFIWKIGCNSSISVVDREFWLENQMQKQYFGWKIGCRKSISVRKSDAETISWMENWRGEGDCPRN